MLALSLMAMITVAEPTGDWTAGLTASGGSGGSAPGVHEVTIAGQPARVVVGDGYDPATPTFLAYYLHGDEGSYNTSQMDTFINDKDWVYIAPLAPAGATNPNRYPWDGSDGGSQSANLAQIKSALDHMIANYNVYTNFYFGSGVSGGSWLYDFYVHSFTGYPTYMNLNCGASQRTTANAPSAVVMENSEIKYTLGTADFLYNNALSSASAYAAVGYRVQTDFMPGVEHCAFSVHTKTVAYWEEAFQRVRGCCTYGVRTSDPTHPAGAGTYTFDLATDASCLWTAQTSAAWITFPASTGSGPGSVSFTLSPNDSGAIRDATITLADKTIPIRQMAEDDAYEENDSFSPTYDLGAHAGKWLSQVDGPGIQCDRDVYSISVPAGALRLVVDLEYNAGDGDIDMLLYDGADNFIRSSRLDTDRDGFDEVLSAAGIYKLWLFKPGASGGGDCQTYDLWWDVFPASCAFETNDIPADIEAPAAGGVTSLTVTVQGGCPLEVAESLDWLSVSVAGNSATLSFDPNDGAVVRQGVIIVADQPVRVQQGTDCSLQVVNAFQVSAEAAVATIPVVQTGSCAIGLTENLSWLSAVLVAGGVEITVDANPDFVPRSGNVSIGGKAVTITQAAQPNPVCVLDPALGYDFFLGRIVLPSNANVSTTGATVGATNEADEPNTNLNKNTVWYQWRPPQSGVYSVELTGSGALSWEVVSVYTGSCIDQLTRIRIHQYRGQPAIAVFEAVAGVDYAISVANWYREGEGDFDLVIQPAALPAHDAFEDAAVLTGSSSSVTISSLGSGLQAGEPPPPPFLDNPGTGSVWVKWVAPADGAYAVQGSPCCNSQFYFELWQGDNLASLALLCRFDFRKHFQAVAGQTYYVRGAYEQAGETAENTFSIRYFADQLAGNNNLADAFPLASATEVAVVGHNAGSDHEAGEPRHGATVNGDASVWYRWTAPAAGIYSFRVTDENFNATPAAYRGTDIAALENASIGPLGWDNVNIQAVAGESIAFVVDGWHGREGSFTGALFRVADTLPVNDDLVDAIPLPEPTTVGLVVTGHNITATVEAGEPGHVNAAADASVWWRFTPGQNQSIEIDIPEPDMDGVRIHVYEDVDGTVANLVSVDGTLVTFSPRTLSFDATAGTTYVIAADRRSSFLNRDEGRFSFELRALAAQTDPVLVAIADDTIDERVPYSFTATASDADLPAQPLSFFLSGAPSGAAIDQTSGVFDWTPTEAQGPGVYTFTVIVSDSTGRSAEQELTLTVREVGAPGATLSGQVFDRAGQPEDGARVYLYMPSIDVTSRLQDATTDASGGFQFTGLEPGTYFVLAGANGSQADAWYQEDNSPPVAFGFDATIPPTATPIILQAEETRTGVDLQRVPTSSLSGRFLDPEGEPLGRGYVKLMTSNGWTVENDFSMPEILFESVLPGRYTLQARSDGLMTSWYGGAPVITGNPEWDGAQFVEIIAGSDLVDVDLMMLPGGALAGQLLNESDLPLIDTRVEIHGDLEDGSRTVNTDSNGFFHVNGLPGGDYYLAAELGSGCLSWFGGPALADDSAEDPYSIGATPIPVLAGETVSGIVFRASSCAAVENGVVEGRVTDQNGGPLFANTGFEIVWIYGVDEQGEQVGLTSVFDTNGMYQIALPVGRYHLLVEGLEFQCPGGSYLFPPTWFGDVARQSTTVTGGTSFEVLAGQTLTGIDIQVDRSAESTLVVDVLTPSGEELACEGSFRHNDLLAVDRDGNTVARADCPGFPPVPGATFTIKGLIAGEVYLRTDFLPCVGVADTWYGDVPVVTGDPVADGATPLMVLPGLHSGVVINARSSGRVAGQVVNEAGDGVFEPLAVVDADGGVVATLESESDFGRFEISTLLPGTYFLRNDKPGFGPRSLYAPSWHDGSPVVSGNPVTDGAASFEVTSGGRVELPRMTLPLHQLVLAAVPNGRGVRWTAQGGEKYVVQVADSLSGPWALAPEGAATSGPAVVQADNNAPATYLLPAPFDSEQRKFMRVLRVIR